MREISAEVLAAIESERRRFVEEIDALIASRPGTEADWDEVFAKWRHQVDVLWPARLRQIEKRTIATYGETWGSVHALPRVVPEYKRWANRVYLRARTEAVLTQPIRLVSADAVVTEGNFSLETPRRLNANPEHPEDNETRINRWGTRLQFEGPVLLDRVEFLLEDNADPAEAEGHLLAWIGLEELKVSVHGRRVTARPPRPMGEVELLDWIDLAWRGREEMVPISSIAVYGRAADRYPFDLRPSPKTEAEAVAEAAHWISARYANRLKRRAARYLIQNGNLKNGMTQSQVTDLLGDPTQASTTQLIYERSARPDFSDPDDFRLVFVLGRTDRVVDIHLQE